MANQLGFDASGLDFKPEFVKQARELLKAYSFDNRYNEDLTWADKAVKKMVFRADATTFDKYGNYDVIYFYRPIKDEVGQTLLETQVAKDAKVGAFVLCVYEPVIFKAGVAEKYGWEQDKQERSIWKRVAVKQP